MELRQLEYFLTVSRCGSFTRAADQLFVSQPAVTSAVRSLETELGICLFDRSQKQARLTMEGEVFRRHVENVMLDVSRTISEVDALKNLSTGLLRFGYGPHLASPALADAFCQFHQRYPKIRFSFIEKSDRELEKLLVDDKIDFALSVGAGNNNRLVYRELPIARMEIALVVGSRHPLSRRNSIASGELAGENFILPPAEYNLRSLLEQAVSAHEIEPAVIAEADTLETAKSLVAAGFGVSAMAFSAVCDDRRFAAIPFAEPLFAAVFLACKTGHQLSKAAEAMLEMFGIDDMKGIY